MAIGDGRREHANFAIRFGEYIDVTFEVKSEAKVDSRVVREICERGLLSARSEGQLLDQPLGSDLQGISGGMEDSPGRYVAEQKEAIELRVATALVDRTSDNREAFVVVVLGDGIGVAERRVAFRQWKNDGGIRGVEKKRAFPCGPAVVSAPCDKIDLFDIVLADLSDQKRTGTLVVPGQSVWVAKAKGPELVKRVRIAIGGPGDLTP